MKNSLRNVLLLLAAGLVLALGTVACSDGDDSSSTTTPTKVKVTTSTTPTGTTVNISEYYLATKGDVSSKIWIQTTAMTKDKVTEYIKYRGNKVYEKDDKTSEIAVANLVVRKTYYVFFDLNAPYVKVWKVKAGTESELIKEYGDDGFTLTPFAYLDYYLKQMAVSTYYKWENSKKGAAVTIAEIEKAGTDKEYCITFIPAKEATYDLTRDGKAYKLYTKTGGNSNPYEIKEGANLIESGSYTQPDEKTLVTTVQTIMSPSVIMYTAPVTVKITYTIGANNVLTQTKREANFVNITQMLTADIELMTSQIAISKVSEYITSLNAQGATYKLYEDKAKTKAADINNLVAEKTYYAVQ